MDNKIEQSKFDKMAETSHFFWVGHKFCFNIKRLRWLANDLSIHVFFYTSYMINGYTFIQKNKMIKSLCKCKVLKIETSCMWKCRILGLLKTWEFDYTIFQVLVFDCKWVGNKNGVRINESGFMQVDLN